MQGTTWKISNEDFVSTYNKCKSLDEALSSFGVNKSTFYRKLAILRDAGFNLPAYARKGSPSGAENTERAFNLSGCVKRLNAKRNALRKLDAKKIEILKNIEADRANLSNDIQDLKKKISLQLGL